MAFQQEIPKKGHQTRETVQLLLDKKCKFLNKYYDTCWALYPYQSCRRTHRLQEVAAAAAVFDCSLYFNVLKAPVIELRKQFNSPPQVGLVDNYLPHDYRLVTGEDTPSTHWVGGK